MKIRNIAVALAATAAVGLFTASTAAAAAPARDTPKPTIVLLHGAFEDASAWSGVTQRLQHDGYPVIAPAVGLRGVAADTDQLKGVVDAIKGPKVLVSHSYGGMLVNGLATAPDVKALVYVNAFIPQPGESAGQLSSQFPGSLLGPDTWHAVDSPAGPELYVNADSFREVFAGDVPAATAAVAAAQQRPILATAFSDKVTAALPGPIRKYALISTDDKAIPTAAKVFMAKRVGATITEVAGSHAVTASNPKAVADEIEKAARS